MVRAMADARGRAASEPSILAEFGASRERLRPGEGVEDLNCAPQRLQDCEGRRAASADLLDSGAG